MCCSLLLLSFVGFPWERDFNSTGLHGMVFCTLREERFCPANRTQVELFAWHVVENGHSTYFRNRRGTKKMIFFVPGRGNPPQECVNLRA